MNYLEFQGLVFGVFELVVFLLSPIFGEFVNKSYFDIFNKIRKFSNVYLLFSCFTGQYMNQIGPKVLFNGGILTTSVSSIIFGLLDQVEVGEIFV